MSYQQLKDGTLVIKGFEQGISDDPYKGLADMRNLNIISIPGEASVNFATSKISAPPLAGSLTTTSDASNTVTLTGGNLEVGQAIFFTNLSNVGAGLANSTPYWVKTGSVGTYTLQSSRATGSSTVNITADSITGSWQTYNMASPRYFTKDNVNIAPNNYWMIDSAGLVWSNTIVTTGSSYWTYMGNTTLANAHGNGIVYYQGSDGAGWIFVMRDALIDYTPALANAISWTYGWKTLKTPGGTNYPHESIVAPDNKVYICDSNWITRFYQAAPGTAFDPTTSSTYVFDQTSVLPFTDTAQCIAPLGNNILIGGAKNVIYPWDTFSQLPSYPILVAENNIVKMLTVNTNTFVLAGNRGRIYVTNGTNAALYKKIPDHLSGTIEPSFVWGGIASTKNQLYVSLVGTTNSGTQLNLYGGLWGIDMDTKALRLTNQLSYGSYAGYAPAIMAVNYPQTALSTSGSFVAPPAGTGLFIGWDTQDLARAVSNGVLNSTTTVTSATIAFTANDVGSTIAGTGIPTGTIISSVTNATTAIMNNTATATATGVTVTISPGFGIDQTIGTPYTGTQPYVDSDYIPIGTALVPTTNSTVEFKLAVPIVSGESVKLQWRQLFSGTDTFTDISTSTLFTYATSTAGGGTGWNGYSGVYQNVNFQNSQWIQIRAVLTSTASSPSYCRITEIRLK